MFDFNRWKAWIDEKAFRMRAEGITISTRQGPTDSPKPGASFGIVTRHAMGSLEYWTTGEADFTIMAPANAEAKTVAHRWMVALSDETFQPFFDEFLDEFWKYGTPTI